MKTKQPFRMFLSAIFSAALYLGVALTNASYVHGDAIVVYLTNDTGARACCLEFTMFGTGGNLTVDPNLVDGGPYPPAISITHNGNQATVRLDWGARVIEPGDTVFCVVHSTNSPISYGNGNWGSGIDPTGGMIVIGPINIPPGPGPWNGPGGGRGPIPPGGGGVTIFYKIEREVRYTNRGARIQYTPWIPGPPRYEHRWFCWWRFCCRPEYKKEVRKVRKCYPRRADGSVGAAIRCDVLTPWKVVRRRKAYYKWRFTSVKPRGVIFPFGFLRFLGAFKDLSDKFADLHVGSTTYTRESFAYDEKTGTATPSTDLGTTFLDLSGVLIPEFDIDEPLPRPSSFKETLQINAEAYANGSAVVAGFADELSAILADPDGQSDDFDLRVLRRCIKVIAKCLASTGHSFANGEAPSVRALRKMARSFNILASEFRVLAETSGKARYLHVADSFAEAAVNMQFAAKQVRLGLDTVGERDDFLWAMLVGLPTNMRDIGFAASDHVRLEFSVPDYVWDTGTIPGALVQVWDSQGTLVDSFDVPVSDRNFIQMPFLGNIEENQAYLVFVKLPTFLSTKTLISAKDDGQTVNLGEMVLGDADDDDCVTDRDLEAVMVDAEKGAGGQEAESVPATDINGDGEVNELDIELVLKSLGKCGTGMTK